MVLFNRYLNAFKTIMNKELLITLEKDFKKNFKSNVASRYWHRRTNRILDELKSKGLKDFRGYNSGIGIGFVDHRNTDIRNVLGRKEKLISQIFNLKIFKSVYSKQLQLTKRYCESSLNFKKFFYENNGISKKLLEKYNFDKTCGWGAVDKIIYMDKEISTHYLVMANRIDFINNKINLNTIKSFCEIGSGFGVNIHFLLSNFKNIKKVICLDIFPTIFILTEYLKSIYGDSVKDYNYFKDKNEITFKNDNELEIYCLPNWEAHKIKSEIDHLHNAHSFVEMSTDQLKLYKNYIFDPYVNSSSFVFYNRNIEEKTFDIETVSKLFSVNFKKYNLPLIEHFKKEDTILIYNK